MSLQPSGAVDALLHCRIVNDAYVADVAEISCKTHLYSVRESVVRVVYVQYLSYDNARRNIEE